MDDFATPVRRALPWNRSPAMPAAPVLAEPPSVHMRSKGPRPQAQPQQPQQRPPQQQQAQQPQPQARRRKKDDEDPLVDIEAYNEAWEFLGSMPGSVDDPSVVWDCTTGAKVIVRYLKEQCLEAHRFHKTSFGFEID